MDILRRVKLGGSELALTMKDSYQKVAISKQKSRVTQSDISSFFIENWIIPYGIPMHVLKDNRRQFVNNLFEPLFAFLEKKGLNTVEQDADRRMKSAHRGYKDDHDRKACNAPPVTSY